MDRAIKECEQGLAILDGLAHNAAVLRDEADLYNTLGAVYIGQGDYSQADQVYQRSTDLRQQAGDLPGLARSYNNLAAICWGRGDLAGVSDYLQRSLEINHQIGDNYGLAFGYNNLGAVNFMRGDADQALDNYRTALSLRQRIGDNYGVAQTCSNVGEAYLSLGQYDAAHRYLEQSASVFETIQSEGELPEVYCLLAEVELAREEIISSLAYAERARRIAVVAGNLEWRGRAERAMARGQARSGDVNKAVQSFEASTESLREAENQAELARSHYELGSLLAATPGREAPAREHLRQAVDLFDAAGSQEDAERARAALAQLEA
jgi:tetratricopeptide (TPR) repeat protein